MASQLFRLLTHDTIHLLFRMRFDTKAVHAGTEPDPTTGAIMTPIYQTSTYVQEAPGVHKGYEYARTQNPTRDALQRALAELENAKYGLCFATGMAAVDAIIRLLNPGDRVVSTNDLYGGTYRLFTKIYQRYGIDFTFVDVCQLNALDAVLDERVKLVWLESPTNPMLNLADLAALSSTAHRFGARVVVDNTFATPCLQNPLDLGADLVMHSVTKYLGGHSDTVMGAVLTSDELLYDQLKSIQNSVGATPGPQDCFLVLRGIKTLHLRMARHCSNALVVAQFLESHPKVLEVKYPGLPSHPQHELAKRQMRGFGGMITFATTGDSIEKAVQVLTRTKVFALAESLGGVESLIGHPATMTHASIPREERLKSGLRDSTIRLSVGIEDPQDLIDDLAQALDSI
jgi:cystathionine beta-lyase/cystathionine gamma-synthase